MGKTAFALNMARNVAVDQGKGVAVFSLEMSKMEVVQPHDVLGGSGGQLAGAARAVLQPASGASSPPPARRCTPRPSSSTTAPRST